MRFLKRWYYFVIGITLCGAFGVYKIYSAEKIFQVKAKAILANPTGTQLASDKNLPHMSLLYENSSVDDKIGVLTSYNLIHETVKRLPLGVSYFSKEPLRKREVFWGAPFQIQLDSAHPQLVYLDIFVKREGDQVRLRAKGSKTWLTDLKTGRGIRELEDFELEETFAVGQTYESPLLKFDIVYDDAWETYPDKEYYFHINTAEGLVAMFQETLKIGVAGELSNIINISMEGPVVDIQKMFINELLESYKRKELAEMRSLGNKTVVYLDSLISELSGEIKVARNEITAQMSQGIDATNTDASLLGALNVLESSYGENQAQLSYYTGIQKALENSSPEATLQLPTSSLGKSDPGLAALIASLEELQQQKASMQMSGTRGPTWELNENKIQNTRRSITANVSSSIDGLKILLENQLKQINDIRVKRGMLPRQRANIEMTSQDKDFKTETLLKLEARKLEAALAVEKASVDIEILEDARMDGSAPIKPKKPLILLISVFLGAVLPLGLIIIQDFFDNRIASHEDIQSSTNLPVLGFIARHDRNSNYIVPKDSRTALAESFRSIRIKMQYLNDNVHQQVIGVTSSSSGEGKTFCVTNIAAVMAQAGKKTLLIDIDLRRPRVTRYFDNKDGLGLSNYLSGEVDDIPAIVAHTHIENLDVIHSGPVATNPLDLIATDRMNHLMEVFREQYDHIVIDAPPLGLVSDYLIIMKLTDFNIYVVRDSSTTIESLKMINELYDNQKIKNIAMLINDVKSVSAYGYIDKHYGYGD